MPKGYSSYHRERDDLTQDAPPPNTQVNATFPPKFKPFLTERSRWKCVYGGRGSGKTESCAKALLLMGHKQPLRILCCREIMQSIRQSSHSVLSTMVGELGLENYYTVEKQGIYGPWMDWTDARGVRKKRRTEFMFAGLREMTVAQIKSYHDVSICWIDEAQAISSRSMRILGPTIRRAGGSDPNFPCELWLSWNPTFETDWVHQNFVLDKLDDSCVIEMNWRDNPWFQASGLKPLMEESRRRNYPEYLHIWEGETIKHWEGQVYQAELKECEEEDRITNVPYRADAPCEVAFDIGGGEDATALWVFQTTVDHFLQWLEQKPYVITKYWLPTDAKQRHAGMQHSYEQLIRMRGKKVQIVPTGAGSVAESINAVRTLFPRFRFDAKRCAKGLLAIRNYRFELASDEVGVFKSTPVHDKYSHFNDSLRYMCQAYRITKDQQIDTRKLYSPAPFRGVQSGWMIS
jgi:phage terminase large subunit